MKGKNTSTNISFRTFHEINSIYFQFIYLIKVKILILHEELEVALEKDSSLKVFIGDGMFLA